MVSLSRPVTGTSYEVYCPGQEAGRSLYEERSVPGTSFTVQVAEGRPKFFTLEIKDGSEVVGKAEVGVSTRFNIVLVEIENLQRAHETILEALLQAAVEVAVVKGVDISDWEGRGCWIDVLGDEYVSIFKELGLYEVSYCPSEQKEFPRGQQKGIVFSNTGGEMCFHLPCDRSHVLMEKVSKQPMYS